MVITNTLADVNHTMEIANLVIKYQDYFLRKITDRTIHINQSGCWIWQGASNGGSGDDRYGAMKVCWPGGSRTMHTHQVSFALYNQRYAARDKQISHLCHNKLCCFAPHLVEETKEENESRNMCRPERRCVGHGRRPACIF